MCKLRASIPFTLGWFADSGRLPGAAAAVGRRTDGALRGAAARRGRVPGGPDPVEQRAAIDSRPIAARSPRYDRKLP